MIHKGYLSISHTRYENIFDKAVKRIEFPMRIDCISTFGNIVINLKLIEGGLTNNVYWHMIFIQKSDHQQIKHKNTRWKEKSYWIMICYF